MKYFFLTFAFFANCAWAQSTVKVTSEFQSSGFGIVNCGGIVTIPIECVDSPSAKSEMSWTNNTINDWAGTTMRARLNIVSPAAGTVAGSVKFSYTPEDKLVAIAIKQSSGSGDLSITGQIDDFTDVEGRRIISFSPSQTLEIEMSVNLPYSTVGEVLKKDFMVEIEPVEYVQ